MSLHNRQLPGHRLVARQRNGGGIFDVPDGNGNGPDGPPGGGHGGPSNSDAGPTSVSTPSQTPSQPTTRPTSPPTTSKTRQPPPTTTNDPEPAPTSTSTEAKPTTTSETSTSSDSTTSISSTTSTSKTSIAPVIVTAPPVIKTTTSSGLLLPSTTISAEPSATTSAAPSGASTGTIIGGVVGGLAAIAAIGIIVAFILRRMRKRREEEEFNSDDFVRPPNMSEPEFQRSSTFDPNPPNMAQLGRNEIISTYSSPGMAGHGAYTYAQGGSAPVSAGSSHGGMQERSNYVYGQGYEGDDNLSDHAHGVYSSEPQVQAAYNPEAYGSYAYSTENQMAAPGGYMNYHQNEVQHGYAHGGDDFAPLSSPYDNAPPAGSAATHGAPPALVAGGPAVAAGRGTNTRSVYEEDDAYGGI